MRNHGKRAIGTLAAAAVLSVVAVYHAHAVGVEREARDTAIPAAERLDEARLATRLEPFNRHMEVTLVAVEAEALLEAERPLDAYDLMHPLVENAVTDAYFGAVYREVAEARIAISARKAHQQHAREKEGGRLDPEDWIP